MLLLLYQYHFLKISSSKSLRFFFFSIARVFIYKNIFFRSFKNKNILSFLDENHSNLILGLVALTLAQLLLVITISIFL